MTADKRRRFSFRTAILAAEHHRVAASEDKVPDGKLV